MNALVLGGADCLWDDLDTIPKGWPELVVACNEAAAHYQGHLDHFVTLHPEKLQGWMVTRAGLGGNMDFTTWTRTMPYGIQDREKLAERTSKHWGGSSGLLAVNVALQMGATRAILCGIPMGPAPHFFDDAVWQDWKEYRASWEQYQHKLGNVRSCSGWTRELLGGPEEWLREAAA